jgi:cytidylate kinase
MTDRHSPRSIESLVNAQIGRWELERTRRAQVEPVVEPPAVIVIAREVGAGGGAVARLVGDTLGFRVWDQEIVHTIADKSGLRESLLASLDEHATSALAELLATLRRRDEAMSAYTQRLAEVVHAIARHGAAVLVGRGSQFLVDAKRALRVRVIAPRDLRAARFAAAKKMSVEEAARELVRADRDREVFVRKHFAEDVNAPLHYDLVVNTAEFSLGAARDVVVAAYQGRFGTSASDRREP